jgi:hypothetical protein
MVRNPDGGPGPIHGPRRITKPILPGEDEPASVVLPQPFFPQMPRPLPPVLDLKAETVQEIFPHLIGFDQIFNGNVDHVLFSVSITRAKSSWAATME